MMEQMLGRSLKPGEVVHHINGDTLDDRPENLQLMNSNEHSRLHHPKRRSKQLRKRDHGLWDLVDPKTKELIAKRSR